MKKILLILSLLILAALLAAGGAWAKQRGKGTPPGQAKKQAAAQAGNGQGGPPPWAPAHGYRAKYKYKYWPKNQVYFAPDRGMYFWLKGDGWQAGVKLPSSITLSGSSVTLEMNDDRPYVWCQDVERMYPPNH